MPLAFPSRDGSLVLTDIDGNELARTANAGLGGEIDATFDPASRTMTTFEASGEDEGGELHRYALDGALGAFVSGGEKYKNASGTMRLASTSLGLVAFEESMGMRWKVFLASGKNAGSIACPRPSSIAIVEGVEQARVVALAQLPEEGGWARVDATLGPNGWGADGAAEATCNSVSLPDLALENPRLVTLADGTELVVGIEEGAVAFEEIGSGDGTESTGAAAAGLGSATSAVIPRAGEEDAHVLVALTARPTRVVVAWWWSEGGVEALRTAWMDLPGEPRVDDRSLTRDVAVVRDRVIAATSEGVFRVDVGFVHGNVTLTRHDFGSKELSSTLAGPITALGEGT